MRLKGRQKLSTISFHRSVLRPTFPLPVIRYWNPFTRRDLQLKIFYGAVSSSSDATRHWTLNTDNAGVLTPWTSHTLRKTRNFLELSWWGVVAALQYCVTWFKYWPGYCLLRQDFRVFFFQSLQVNSGTLLWNKRGGTVVKNSQKPKRMEQIQTEFAQPIKCQCNNCRSGSPCDKTLDLSPVPPVGRCPYGIMYAYLFIYLIIYLFVYYLLWN